MKPSHDPSGSAAGETGSQRPLADGTEGPPRRAPDSSRESADAGAGSARSSRHERGGSKGERAVGLVSGGLDSTLAAEMLQRQGVAVTGLHFSTGFCKVDHRRAVRRRKDRDPGKLRNGALRAGADGGFPVEVIDVSREYLQMVLNPKHGYGAHANPCIDCRIFMLRKAKEYADAVGADTIFTGEVIGQRPFSQHREALRVIEQQSGLEGRLLRPLSAKHFAPTRAERDGRIDREGLGAVNGRSRRAQERLAEAYGITDYPQPSGGCCYLADETYARRFKDLLAHREASSITQEDLVLLKVGRQFRLSPAAKLHVGREEAENRFLQRFAAGRWLLEAQGVEGPTGIVTDVPSESDLRRAAAIVARYADLNGATTAEVLLTRLAPSLQDPVCAASAWSATAPGYGAPREILAPADNPFGRTARERASRVPGIPSHTARTKARSTDDTVVFDDPLEVPQDSPVDLEGGLGLPERGETLTIRIAPASPADLEALRV